MADEPTLITLTVSHFSEKARWALQRCGIAYTEEAHAPGFHRVAVKAAGGRGPVPCLRLPPVAGTSGAGCVDQSTPIMHWADEQCTAAGRPPPAGPLFPPGARGAEVERLCAEWDRRLGPATRLWAYSHSLYVPATGEALVAPPVPTLERFVMRWGGWRVMRRVMAKARGRGCACRAACGGESLVARWLNDTQTAPFA